MSRCPICKKVVADEGPDRPFCSPRCKAVDLGRWLGEAYRVSRPVTPEDEDALPTVTVVEGADAGEDDEPVRH